MYLFYYSFDKELEQKIIAMQQRMLEDGHIRPESQLKNEYIMFRKRFGPDVLQSLSGEALIETIFNVMNRDSLAYWLEFKNDESFNTQQYGSIAGGGSHKYILYKRKSDQKWIAGVGQNQRVVSLNEAVEKGGNIRDAILRGVKHINRIDSRDDKEYIKLQKLLDQKAEYKIGHYGWIHKYYHMLFPELIDTFHSTYFQQHALLCSGIKPVSKNQLYSLTGQLMQKITDLPMLTCHAVKAMMQLYGPPVNYFRIGTRSEGTGISMWSNMWLESYIAIDWKALGDLREYGAGDGGGTKEKIRQRYNSVYPDKRQTMNREVNEICRFFDRIKENDIVAACDGETLLGIGRVTGDYEYIEELEFPHIRKVEWLFTGEAKLPNEKEAIGTTVTQYKNSDNIIAIRKLLSDEEKLPKESPDVPAAPAEKSLPPLPDEIKRIESILERKKQVIFYGPPGTGKTYYAEKAACELAARRRFRKTYDSLDETERDILLGDGRQKGYVRMCCFHPSYGYEDFIEGIKPGTANGAAVFELCDGIFKTLCRDAQSQPEYDFFLVIDEINRGDISRVFGELITLIEKGRRGKSLSLPVSGESFLVPPNVYIIGTMNTADRSIALLDTALRRRFGFKEFLPDYTLLEGVSFGSLPLAGWLHQLNQKICRSLGRDARSLQIGHSYFMEEGKVVTSQSRFSRILAEDVLPLIEEYCYGDYAKMADILGTLLVDTEHQNLQYKLFEGCFDDLVNSLLQTCPDIQETDVSDAEEEAEGDEDTEWDSEAAEMAEMDGTSGEEADENTDGETGV